MNRTLLNFWLDVVLLILFLTELWIAFVVRFLFPSPVAAAGWNLWGWGYDRWADLQFIVLALFGLAVLLHVMLHWTWICGVVTGRLMSRTNGKRRTWDDGIRTIYGVGFLVVLLNLLGVAFAAAALSVQGPM